MIVTDKEYYIDDKYLSKLDLMIKRMRGTDDAILPIDGDEGQGKTELAMGTCYYVAYKMKRKYDIDNIFFNLDEVIEFAVSTKDQIIHLDEGALDLLSNQWWKQNQQKFLKLVMMARKKRHFIVICIPKFYKLNKYLIEDRAIGLVHVYSRQNLQKGRFTYYTKKTKEKLYDDWLRKKLKSYKKHSVLHGSFVIASKKIFDKKQMKVYEDKKDQAILSITTEKETRKKPDMIIKETNVKIYKNLLNMGIKLKQAELCEIFERNPNIIRGYTKEINGATSIA